MRFSLFAISCLLLSASAIKLPVRLTRRDNLGALQLGTSNAASSSGQAVGLTDNKDLAYIVNVTIAGQSYQVQLDTGSSDLWITVGDTVPGKQSSISYNLTYGIGYASGPIATAPVSFAGYNIPSQAFLAGQQVNNPAMAYGAQGILGTGFTSLSSIDMKVNQSGASWGRSLFYNVFAQNPNEPNFMAVALQRNDDPHNDVQGSFTIGEYDQDYAAVANTAPIPTYPQTNPTRWSLLVDKVIANGQAVSQTSAVQNVPSNKAVGLLDTGTSYVYAPEDVVTAIYGSLPDATFSASLNKWIVPCDAEVDISIVIGNRQFDIHPLDTVQPTTTDFMTCTGTWQPQSFSVGKSEFDYLFGDAVLRSFYAVYDFGDFDSNKKLGSPYFRLWSLVNGSDASAEFHQVRGGTPNNTFLTNKGVNAASANPNTPSSNDSSPSSSGPDVADLQSKVDKLMKWAPYALGLLGFNVLILLVVLVVGAIGCMRQRKGGRAAAGTSGTFIPLPVAGGNGHQYRPVSLQSVETPRPNEPSKYSAGARYTD